MKLKPQILMIINTLKSIAKGGIMEKNAEKAITLSQNSLQLTHHASSQ